MVLLQQHEHELKLPFLSFKLIRQAAPFLLLFLWSSRTSIAFLFAISSFYRIRREDLLSGTSVYEPFFSYAIDYSFNLSLFF